MTFIKIYIYGDGDKQEEKRYCPAECTGKKTEIVNGTPSKKHISTSYVERQNLTMRMSLRRFTRLTNGFSKKLENHIAAISLHFMYYDFCRTHQKLRMTPRWLLASSIALWEVADIIRIMEEFERTLIDPRGREVRKGKLVQRSKRIRETRKEVLEHERQTYQGRN